MKREKKRVPDAQLRILVVLWKKGRKRFTGSKRALARELDISPGHVNKDLQSLIDEGYVRENQASREYVLTGKGSGAISFLTYPYYVTYLLAIVGLLTTVLPILALLSRNSFDYYSALFGLTAFGLIALCLSLVLYRLRNEAIERFYPGEENLLKD